MIILGIDPGYERCGFAVLEKTTGQPKLLNFGVIKTKAQTNFAERQTEIANDFQGLLDRYQPQLLAIEDLFFVQNITTGLHVAQVRGILIYLAHQTGCQVVEPAPTQVKKAFCGDGKADKTAMRRMAKMTFKLQSAPKLDDAADAIGVAWTGCFLKP